MIKLTNVKNFDCPTCGAFEGERCQRSAGQYWKWCEKRILICDGKIPDPSDPIDHDDLYCDDGRDFEQEEEDHARKHRAYLRGLTNEKLAREWDRECNRHDGSIDRGEAMNNLTIEEAQSRMNFIEKLFKERGVSLRDFDIKEEASA